MKLPKTPAFSLSLLLALVSFEPAAEAQNDVDKFDAIVGTFQESIDMGRIDRAENLAQQLKSHAQQADVNEDIRTLMMTFHHQAMGIVLMEKGQHENALPLLQKCLKTRRGTLESNNYLIGAALKFVGRAQRNLGNSDAAIAAWEECLPYYEAKWGMQSQTVAGLCLDLGEAHLDADQADRAESIVQRAVTILENELGAKHIDVAFALSSLASCHYQAGEFEQAEALSLRALRIKEQELKEAPENIAVQLEVLGDVNLNGLCRYTQAEEYYRRSLAIWEEQSWATELDAIHSIDGLANSCFEVEKYGEAVELHRRALKIREAELPADDSEIADSLVSLAVTYLNGLNQYEKAEPLFRRALAIHEKTLGKDSLQVAYTKVQLGWICFDKANFDEARSLFSESWVAYQRELGDEHPDTAWALLSRASFTASVDGDHASAEQHLKNALAVLERKGGEASADVANGLISLADIYITQSRLAEAQPLVERALQIRIAKLGPNHSETAWARFRLAKIHSAHGRYAEAESLGRAALLALTTTLGEDHPGTASMLADLSYLYHCQGRNDEAEALALKSVAIAGQAYGEDSIEAQGAKTKLGLVYIAQKRFTEAEEIFRNYLQRSKDRYGENDIEVAYAMEGLAAVHFEQGKIEQAEVLYSRAAECLFNHSGETADYTLMLSKLGEIRELQGRFDEAERLADRIILLRDRVGVGPDDRSHSYAFRARLAWRDGRRGEALADQRRAMDLAEQQRVLISGTERERAKSFSLFTGVFEQMVRWQVEMDDVSEALSAMERGRARSMLDELSIAGADLDLGRSSAQREQTRQRENQLRAEIGLAVKELKVLRDQPPTSKTKQRTKDLNQQINNARATLYQMYADQKSQNQVYRNLLTTGQAPPRVSQVQRRLLGERTLLLSYLMGDKGGYLLAMTHDDAKLMSLEVDAEAAETLGIQPGPLTAEQINGALITGDGSGVLEQLRDKEQAGRMSRKLAALCRLVIPEPFRSQLLDGEFDRLVVVPDAQLALMPFEALVVEDSHRPTYLLDAGPPVHYAPSVSVLFNLANRRNGAGRSRTSVLTVGDPRYGDSASDSNVGSTETRFVALGGELAPLPHSGRESQWIKEIFEEQGAKATALTGTSATEENVAQHAADQSIIHLACHGLSDAEHGNYFGALALAQGEADDGFLTLAEIYQLNLSRCELTILSACDSNIGPQQKGEGVWALSRGFLVAGARRVVASNWTVDDEAGAVLMSLFCRNVAGQKDDTDYAASLQDAKRRLRERNAEWANPYYWSTFVLMGPQ